MNIRYPYFLVLVSIMILSATSITFAALTSTNDINNTSSNSSVLSSAKNLISYGCSSGNCVREDTPAIPPCFEYIIMHHFGKNVNTLEKAAQIVHTKQTRGSDRAYFGYHFIIDKKGNVAIVSPLNKRTNHIKGSAKYPKVRNGMKAPGAGNNNALGISLLGEGSKPTPLQELATVQLVRAMQVSVNNYSGNQSCASKVIPSSNIFGHKEVQSDKSAGEGIYIAKKLRTMQAPNANISIAGIAGDWNSSSVRQQYQQFPPSYQVANNSYGSVVNDAGIEIVNNGDQLQQHLQDLSKKYQIDNVQIISEIKTPSNFLVLGANKPTTNGYNIPTTRQFNVPPSNQPQLRNITRPDINIGDIRTPQNCGANEKSISSVMLKVYSEDSGINISPLTMAFMSGLEVRFGKHMRKNSIGACGPWQILEKSATKYGISPSRRCEVYQSTKAMLNYYSKSKTLNGTSLNGGTIAQAVQAKASNDPRTQAAILYAAHFLPAYTAEYLKGGAGIVKAEKHRLALQKQLSVPRSASRTIRDAIPYIVRLYYNKRGLTDNDMKHFLGCGGWGNQGAQVVQNTNTQKTQQSVALDANRPVYNTRQQNVARDIFGSGRQDTLIGSSGSDTLAGGQGQDNIQVVPAHERLYGWGAGKYRAVPGVTGDTVADRKLAALRAGTTVPNRRQILQNTKDDTSEGGILKQSYKQGNCEKNWVVITKDIQKSFKLRGVDIKMGNCIQRSDLGVKKGLGLEPIPGIGDVTKYLQKHQCGGKRKAEVIKLNPYFAHRLAKLFYDAEKAGHTMKIVSGMREPCHQMKLWVRKRASGKSPSAARHVVAPPPASVWSSCPGGATFKKKGYARDVMDAKGSRHNYGIAVDIGYGGRCNLSTGKSKAYNKARAWTHAHAGESKYNLYFRMGHEPWHIEPKNSSAIYNALVEGRDPSAIFMGAQGGVKLAENIPNGKAQNKNIIEGSKVPTWKERLARLVGWGDNEDKKQADILDNQNRELQKTPAQIEEEARKKKLEELMSQSPDAGSAGQQALGGGPGGGSVPNNLNDVEKKTEEKPEKERGDSIDKEEKSFDSKDTASSTDEDELKPVLGDNPYERDNKENIQDNESAVDGDTQKEKTDVSKNNGDEAEDESESVELRDENTADNDEFKTASNNAFGQKRVRPVQSYTQKAVAKVRSYFTKPSERDAFVPADEPEDYIVDNEGYEYVESEFSVELQDENRGNGDVVVNDVSKNWSPEIREPRKLTAYNDVGVFAGEQSDENLFGGEGGDTLQKPVRVLIPLEQKTDPDTGVIKNTYLYLKGGVKNIWSFFTDWQAY